MDHVIPHVPVRRWVLSLPIPLCLLLAAQPKLVTPVLQVVHRVIARFLLDQAGLKSDEAGSGAITLIQRFGSAANLNIHLHCLVLDGVYRRGIDGTPEFVEVPEPTDEALQAVLHKIITRTVKLLTRRGVLVEEEGSTYIANNDSDSDEARTLRPLQAAAGRCRPLQAAAGRRVYLPHRLRPARWAEVADGTGRHAQGCGLQADAVRRQPRLQPTCRGALLRRRSPGAGEQLCRYITRPALANERVQTNAAGQVVLKLKTP